MIQSSTLIIIQSHLRGVIYLMSLWKKVNWLIVVLLQILLLGSLLCFLPFILLVSFSIFHFIRKHWVLYSPTIILVQCVTLVLYQVFRFHNSTRDCLHYSLGLFMVRLISCYFPWITIIWSCVVPNVEFNPVWVYSWVGELTLTLLISWTSSQLFILVLTLWKRGSRST